MSLFDEKKMIVNRAGFRLKGADEVMQFFILSETWRGEVCAGMNPATVNKALSAAGFLHPGDTGAPTIRRRLPGIGLARCYHVTADILARDGDGKSGKDGGQ